MKLINDKGQFGFLLTEGKIECDTTLPKFQKINEVLKTKKPKHVEPLKFNSDEESDGTLSFDTTAVEKIDSSNNTEAVESLTTTNLHQFMTQTTAEKFNLIFPDRLMSSARNSSWWSGSISNANPSFLSTGNLLDANDGGKMSFWDKLTSIKDIIFSDKPSRDWSGKLVNSDKEKQFSIDVTDIFDFVKIEAGKEKEFIDRVDNIVSLIKKAQILRQDAQTEMLLSKLTVHIYEAILSMSGMNNYVTAENLIELQKKCSRIINIDYIKNFNRVIPDEVALKKIAADELLVFDNYVVMYYDPTGKSSAKTEAEKKKEEHRRRDPILFGLINGSDKLYYIADWVDELCDLTWDDIIKKTTPGKLL